MMFLVFVKKKNSIISSYCLWRSWFLLFIRK